MVARILAVMGAGVLLWGQSAMVSAGPAGVVEQTHDINAKNRATMYQFIPDYLEVNVGDTIRFTGTVGRHTVHSVPGMIPEGAERIAIMPGNHPDKDVTFTKPGVYGVQCKYHGRHGMVMTLVVGKDAGNVAAVQKSVDTYINPFARAKMHKLLDRAEGRWGVASNEVNVTPSGQGVLHLVEVKMPICEEPTGGVEGYQSILQEEGFLTSVLRRVAG